eukprot:COSAG01_NODE_3125_length_6546_cov_6.634869_2_plen_129_part_00
MEALLAYSSGGEGKGSSGSGSGSSSSSSSSSSDRDDTESGRGLRHLRRQRKRRRRRLQAQGRRRQFAHVEGQWPTFVYSNHYRHTTVLLRLGGCRGVLSRLPVPSVWTVVCSVVREWIRGGGGTGTCR